MTKHFGPTRRVAATAALALGYALRSISPGRSTSRRDRRASARTALGTLLGLTPPPFGDPTSR
jgi:hypothetical protein